MNGYRDHSTYNPYQKKSILVPPGQGSHGIPSDLTLGPTYFDTFATLPNARYIVDIPFASNNLTNSKEFAKAAYDRIGPSNIFAFEIGNEVNNYGHDVRKHWSIPKYISQWSNWSKQILNTLGLSQDDKIYQAVALSSEEGPEHLPGDPKSDWKM